MSGETEQQVSGWTVDTLKEHMEARLKAADKALELREKQIDRELEHLNKLRIEVMADRDQFVQKETWESKEKDKALWRENVNKRLTTIETRIVTWTAAIGFFFLIVNLVLKYFGK